MIILTTTDRIRIVANFGAIHYQVTLTLMRGKTLE